MAVLAVQHIRRMRGGAQGQLMLGADGHVYVVKFQNNPQHIRVLANELLASRLAQAAGLTAPEVDLVEVSNWLVEKPECFMSRRLLGECRSFVRLADGGSGARPGTHDDRVMAMAIALGARAELLEGSRHR